MKRERNQTLVRMYFPWGGDRALVDMSINYSSCVHAP